MQEPSDQLMEPLSSTTPPRGSAGFRLRRAFFKPVYHLYYRALYRRRLPGLARLAAAVQRWEVHNDRRDVPVSAERWNQEYEQGHWDFLDEQRERVRYERVAALICDVPEGPIVDVGCGEGLLLGHLGPNKKDHYVGVDLSPAAIEVARRRYGGERKFLVGDAETFAPPAECAAVVLNECVYYFNRPRATVKRLLNALRAEGRLVISAVDSVRSRAILKSISREFRGAQSEAVRHGNTLWHIMRIDR